MPSDPMPSVAPQPAQPARSRSRVARALQGVLHAGRDHARGANEQRKMLLTNAVAALAVLNVLVIAAALLATENRALNLAAFSLLPWLVPFALTIELNRRGRRLAASWCLLLSISLATLSMIAAGLGTLLASQIFLFDAAAIAPILLPVRHRRFIIVFACANLALLLFLQLHGWPAHAAMHEVPLWIVKALTGFLIAAALASLFVIVLVTEFWASANEIELGAQALSDSLTGLPNRLAFRNELGREMERARRSQAPLALAMIDIDHFKHVNDRYGHAVGDHVLRRLSQVLGGVMRGSDLLARWGGEEFVALIADADLSGAVDIAERLRRAVAGGDFSFPGGGPLPITVSIGLAALPCDGDVDATLARADQALYAAKAAGRNRTVAA
jgi:diguanylate cyclase (GGDEF)-like protein